MKHLHVVIVLQSAVTLSPTSMKHIGRGSSYHLEVSHFD